MYHESIHGFGIGAFHGAFVRLYEWAVPHSGSSCVIAANGTAKANSRNAGKHTTEKGGKSGNGKYVSHRPGKTGTEWNTHIR
jgi:hypothetical protein